ncbi:MAG: hypothetical protein K9M54_10595 [Kiritimatiellales bacterium]|nr:hypothetical protein [Kiritimatiellales bacterium]
MKILAQFLKICSVVVVVAPAILLFVRDWKMENKKSWAFRLTTWLSFVLLILASLLALASIWLDPYLQSRIAQEELLAARPHPVITVSETSDSAVVLEIYSPTNNSKMMQNLNLAFDIPGKNARCRIVDSTRTSDCVITNDFLASVSGDTVAETIHFACKSILPSGFVRAKIEYERTRRRPVPGSVEHGITNMYYLPVMDLRDYSPCFYTWLYNGQEAVEKQEISLTNLAYIVEDNENMYHTFRLEDRPDLPSAMRTHAANMWTPEFFQNIEERRKHW